MQYTKAQRKSIADAFRAAKEVLWNGTGCLPRGKERYICYALTMSPGMGGRTLAKKIISERLGRHAYLENWLSAQGVPRVQQTVRRMQQHRHAWLDLLIKEFSA